MSAADTVSCISAAGVPGRGEYLKEYAAAYPICVTSARVAAKSSAVSPGKPTIKSDENAMSWRALRKRSMTSRYSAAVGTGCHRQRHKRNHSRESAVRRDRAFVEVVGGAGQRAQPRDAGDLRKP